MTIFLMLNRVFVKLAPFPLSMYGLTSFGRLLCLMLGNAQLLKFG